MGPIKEVPNSQGDKLLFGFVNTALALGMGAAMTMTSRPWAVGAVGVIATGVGAYFGLDVGLGLGLSAGLLARGIKNSTPIVNALSGGSLPADALSYIVPGAQVVGGTVGTVLYANSFRKRLWVHTELDSTDRCMMDPIRVR